MDQVRKCRVCDKPEDTHDETHGFIPPLDEIDEAEALLVHTRQQESAARARRFKARGWRFVLDESAREEHPDTQQKHQIEEWLDQCAEVMKEEVAGLLFEFTMGHCVPGDPIRKFIADGFINPYHKNNPCPDDDDGEPETDPWGGDEV